MPAERFPFENGLFHVTNRGVDRRNIVLDDHDRTTWLRLLGRNAARRGWRVFAFALLDNHLTDGRAQTYRIQNWRGLTSADGKPLPRQF
jgi:hypothetical protein